MHLGPGRTGLVIPGHPLHEQQSDIPRVLPVQLNKVSSFLNTVLYIYCKGTE